MGNGSHTGDYKGFVLPRLINGPCSDIMQANILITNDTPPRACLADFSSLTMIIDPGGPTPCSTQSDGVSMFMPPELLVPSNPGAKDSIPTMEADIYAFGLVIFQVNEQNNGYSRPLSNFLQVLAGDMPFRDLRHSELVIAVVRGKRPDKPEGASEIGFSDSLWDFTQLCWDSNPKRRPKVAEVVQHLGEAATNWRDPMPPRVRPEPATPVPRGEEFAHRESRMLVLPRSYQSVTTQIRSSNAILALGANTPACNSVIPCQKRRALIPRVHH
jgi:hypothetical protein